ncbi:MAG: hypothetical protein M3Y66_09670 [Actinomycetota bacterium]|nr:hypothetical protein [Actinomycetota bacterium]
MPDDERHDLAAVVLKVIGVAVAVGLVIGLGVLVMVKALGVGGSTPSAHSSTFLAPPTPSALPTVALSSPGTTDSTTPGNQPTVAPSSESTNGKAIQLSASPMIVKPMEKIFLTGTWRRHDNVALQVQRKENGGWTDFANVQAQVQVGTFTTYVMTSRVGDNKFRVRDPATGKVSNSVTVTVH